MGKRRDGSSSVFGRSLALLLVVLFVLTGTQMGLSLVRDYSRGTVLGENSNSSDKDKKDNKDNKDDKDDNERSNNHDTVVPTTAVAPITATSTPIKVPTTITTPTIIITPEPTVAISEELDSTSPSTTNSEPSGSPTTIQESASVNIPVEVKSSSGNVVTTTTAVDRGTGETVRQIISKFGINTPAATVELAAPALKTTVKAVEEKTAGEILRELETLPSQTGGPQVRLRYKFVNGQMTLVGETDTGEETPLSMSESAGIMSKLARSAALEVKPGGSGELVFTKGQIRAVTELSLLVDLRTNLLTAETSTGIKTVPLLPDESIKIAFASRVVDGVYSKKNNAEISFSEAENGRLVYQIDGLSKRRLFGLIPMTIRETALVDAANGQVSQPDKSLGKLLVELVAFPIR